MGVAVGAAVRANGRPRSAGLGRHGPGDYFFDRADGFELPEVFGEFVFGKGLKEFPSGGSVDQHDALDEFSFGHNRGLPVGVWRGGRRRIAATPVEWMRPAILARRFIIRASGYRRASWRDLRRRKCERHYGRRGTTDAVRGSRQIPPSQTKTSAPPASERRAATRNGVDTIGNN